MFTERCPEVPPEHDEGFIEGIAAMLERLFTSRVRVRLLTLFLIHPTEAFYIRQIARLTGETYNNVRQELQNLAQIGLILSERRANATYYWANVEHFLFPELKRIILKTEALGDRLREALSTLGDIRVAFIYGGSLGVGVNNRPESPTCWGLSRCIPNELGSPTPYPREIPKGQVY